MKNLYNFCQYHFFAFLFILSCVAKTYACENFGVAQRNIKIPFGTSVAITCIATRPEGITWMLISPQGKTLQTGTGLQLPNTVFDVPGIYLAIFKQPHPIIDEGGNMEKAQDTAFVQVMPVRMVFDFSQLHFSDTIRKRRPTNAITLTVPVRVNIYKGKKAIYTVPTVVSAGVGTHITAAPTQPVVTLKNGETLLHYRLQGVADEEAFIMFDFTDINNQVQSFSLLTKVK